MAKRIFAIPDKNGVITVLCGTEVLDIVVIPPGGGPGGGGPGGGGPTGDGGEPTGGGSGGQTGSGGGWSGGGGGLRGSGGKLGREIFDDPAAMSTIKEAWRQHPHSPFNQIETYYYRATRPEQGGYFDLDSIITGLGAELEGQNIPTPRAIVVGGVRGIDIHDVATLSGRIQESYFGAGVGFDFWKLKP